MGYMTLRSRAFWRRLSLGAAAALFVLSSLLAIPAGAGAQTVDPADIAARDRLIANQEALLNVYRCRFGIDTQIVLGGRQDGAPARPATQPVIFTGTPTQADIAVRDRLISSQEALLNVYRCRFGIDTQIVLGGCQDGHPAPLPTQSADRVLTPQEVFARVSPSIPLVQTPLGQGSGILIEGGYVVTNHHVVWPHDEVRVVFPDGTEFKDVPVLNYDYIADLAVLGPLTHSVPALRLANGEGMASGSELYLIGYPSEAEEFPVPTITGGLLSRIRQWDTYGLTLLQTDAAIAGGQSGGALVNNSGEVVGISTWSFSDAGFAVATSAADDAVLVQNLIHNALNNLDYGLGNRSYTTQNGELTHEVDTWSSYRGFIFEGVAGTVVTITIDGKADGFIEISNAEGRILTVDETLTGEETATFEVHLDGIHFVSIDSYSSDDVGDYSFEMTSSIRLLPFDDPDDGWKIDIPSLGSQGLYHFFDYYGDINWGTIELEAGESILVSADSIIADTVIVLWDPKTGETYSDDDSGPPSVLSDTFNAQLRFTAPSDGTYFIFISDYYGDFANGYYLLVEHLG